MSSHKAVKLKLPKKKSPEQQAVVDEILQVVRDQGRRISLSNTDYRIQKRLDVIPDHLSALADVFKPDDSESSCANSSDLSYSPPGTAHDGNFQCFFDSDSEAPETLTRRNRRNLPPLDPRKMRRPARPLPPQKTCLVEGSRADTDIEVWAESSWPVKPKLVRPKSSRGIRSRPRCYRTHSEQ